MSCVGDHVAGKEQKRRVGKRPKPKTRAEKNALKRETDPLNDQERLFVQEYLVHRNGMRAYKKVYGCISYSASAVGASNLLKRANIRAEIQSYIRAQGERTKITADRVLKEIGSIAFADLEELEEEDGRMKRLRDIPVELRKAIAGIEVRKVSTYTDKDTEETVEESIIRYKLWDKNAALAKLAKHLGLDSEITPLEALLQILPADVAATVREALARGAGTAK